jgi:hypothetical protein
LLVYFLIVPDTTFSVLPIVADKQDVTSELVERITSIQGNPSSCSILPHLANFYANSNFLLDAGAKDKLDAQMSQLMEHHEAELKVEKMKRPGSRPKLSN